jgi:hypothetical protein
MRRRLVLILFGALTAALVLVPVAWGDLYANLGPGGATSPAVDRYPLDNYVLDTHFSAVKASLTGGVDASGIGPYLAWFIANQLWLITAFCANAIISLFALAFSVDLVNGSPSTAGGGALAPVSDAIHNLYANTLGKPWMEVAILLSGCWAMWRALVQRRYTETASALAMSLLFCLLAMAIVARPDATIGEASKWNNRISTAFLSVTSHGEVASGPAARRAVSDQLFDMLVFRPWVALEFGGTEHCIRRGTGGKDHDPESVTVRPLADDPHEDARALAELHRTGHLLTADKECVDNTIRYPGHFLRYPDGSDDRNAEYDAINKADPSKLPDSDPAKDTYKPAIVDKPATDAMEKGGQYQRLLLALVVFVGELGAMLLLGSLCVSVLMAQMVVLLLAGFSPVALVAAVVPGRGHALFKAWAGQLGTFLVRKAAYSLVLAVLLAITAALQDATSNLGWLLSFAMQSMLYWMVFLNRHKLAGQLIAAVSGQQPERDAQLRKVLGVAFVAWRMRPARRRGRGSGPAPDDREHEDDQSGPDNDDPTAEPPDGPAPAPPSSPPPPDSPWPDDDAPRGPSPDPRAGAPRSPLDPRHGPVRRRRGDDHGRGHDEQVGHDGRGESDGRRHRPARRPSDDDSRPEPVDKRRPTDELRRPAGRRTHTGPAAADESQPRPPAVAAPPSPTDELLADEMRREGGGRRRHGDEADELRHDDARSRRPDDGADELGAYELHREGGARPRRRDDELSAADELRADDDGGARS